MPHSNVVHVSIAWFVLPATTVDGLSTQVLSFDTSCKFDLIQGCKTGYTYRNPDIFKSEEKEPKSREVTPAKTSTARTEMTIYRDANIRRTASLGRGNTYRYVKCAGAICVP